MKRIVILASVVLWTAQLAAETYSWIDDNGTYNFTEDLSSVPKKYRKKVQRRTDLDSVPLPASSPTDRDKTDKVKSSEPVKAKVVEEKKDGAASDGKQLFGGKTLDAWRAELSQHEAELIKFEQQIEALRSRLNIRPDTLSSGDRATLTAEYNNLNTTYKQRDGMYNDVLEAARKAGLEINIKK